MTDFPDWQERTHLLLGDVALTTLKNTNILIVGLGGVGAYAAEMLCRAGIGNFHIIDADIIQPSNINRQILALNSTNQKSKAQLMHNRLIDINPEANIIYEQTFIDGPKVQELMTKRFDYIVDAIDTLVPKIFLIEEALKANIPIISSMGCGGKTNPSLIKIDDFENTYNDKLAKMLRKRLHKKNIYNGFKVIFSSEQTNPQAVKFIDNEKNKKTTVGTLSYMPAIFGCFIASEIIRTIAKIKDFKY